MRAAALKVILRWQPLMRRVSNKKDISEGSHEKHRELIQDWYQTIWHENQALGYKIHGIEWEKNVWQVTLVLLNLQQVIFTTLPLMETTHP